MRLALPAIAGVAVLAACSSFGAEDVAPTDAGGAGPDAQGADAAVEGAPVVPGARLCPVAGALFCSDFEQGALIAEWLPETTPTFFLTLDSVGGEHAHALRATLGSGSKAVSPRETLEKSIGSPSHTIYAFDVLVDQSDPNAVVEIASVGTVEAASTLAFHITLEKGSFAFAEYSRAGNPPYNSTKLIPIDAKWHRFEITAAAEGATVRVTARVDGGPPLVDRPTMVKPSSAPPTQLRVSAGVNNISTVSTTLRYAIDNLTVFAH